MQLTWDKNASLPNHVTKLTFMAVRFLHKFAEVSGKTNRKLTSLLSRREKKIQKEKSKSAHRTGCSYRKAPIDKTWPDSVRDVTGEVNGAPPRRARAAWFPEPPSGYLGRSVSFTSSTTVMSRRRQQELTPNPFRSRWRHSTYHHILVHRRRTNKQQQQERVRPPLAKDRNVERRERFRRRQREQDVDSFVAHHDPTQTEPERNEWNVPKRRTGFTFGTTSSRVGAPKRRGEREREWRKLKKRGGSTFGSRQLLRRPRTGHDVRQVLERTVTVLKSPPTPIQMSKMTLFYQCKW